jgi:hypothetical protein
VLALLALCACAPRATQVTPDKGVTAAPRSDTCSIELFEIETLARPYEVLAVIRVPYEEGRLPYLQEVIRRQACAPGADAVVGLHKLVGTAEVTVAGGKESNGADRRTVFTVTLAGTAVRYR